MLVRQHENLIIDDDAQTGNACVETVIARPA
jgi:hypothetical protein